MKTRSNKTVRCLRTDVLAGILALGGSASALAALPQAPTLDWVQVTPQYGEARTYVEVYAEWFRLDVEDITAVQYRIDGKPIMSEAVTPDQNYGDVFFPIDEHGEFEFTVALCNAYGCVESNTATISISDDYGVNAIVNDATPLAIVPQSMPIDGYHSSSVLPGDRPEMIALEQQQAFLGGLASELGKAALSGIVKGGAQFGFDSLMEHLGLGQDDFSKQLDELKASVKATNQRIDDLTDSIEALKEEVAWQGFIDQHTDANKAVNAIYDHYKRMADNIEAGIPEEDADWRVSRAAIIEALSDLAGSEMNQGNGIIDMKDGAIYQLIAAVPQPVTSTQSYWAIIDQYRDYYRTAVSFGYLALDLIEDNYDGSGATRIDADNALAKGQMAVLAMYRYGVAPQLPTVDGKTIDFLHTRGKVGAVTTASAAHVDDNTWVTHSNVYLDEFISEMATLYRPKLNGGQTLEELFHDANVPTSYLRTAHYGDSPSRWETAMLKDGILHEGIPPTYLLRPRVGQITGNSWTEAPQSLCDKNRWICHGYGDRFEGWHVTMREEVNKRQNAIIANGGFTLRNDEFAHANFGWVVLTNRLNHGGRAADFDDDAVRLAAFGDGAATLAAGTLPGADLGSECIGLPAAPLKLMKVDNYSLHWQPDGTLTLEDVNGKVQWASQTQNNADALCFHASGSLVIYNGSQVVFDSDTSDASHNGAGGRMLKLQKDGLLQIVNKQNDVLWEPTLTK